MLNVMLDVVLSSGCVTQRRTSQDCSVPIGNPRRVCRGQTAFHAMTQAENAQPLWSERVGDHKVANKGDNADAGESTKEPLPLG